MPESAVLRPCEDVIVCKKFASLSSQRDLDDEIVPRQRLETITEGSSIQAKFPSLSARISLHTILGRRKAQEDRFCIAPRIAPGRKNCALFGVFDGTVGDFASDTVKDLVVPCLQRSKAFQDLCKMSNELSDHSKTELLKMAMLEMYESTDTELLRLASIAGKHFATSTSVTLLLWEVYSKIIEFTVI